MRSCGLLFLLLLARTAGRLHSSLRPVLPARKPLDRAVALRGGFGGGFAGNLVRSYSDALVSSPILTKSLTSGVIFTASDLSAQAISPPDGGQDWKRTIASGLVGLLYFGPAAHYWFQTVFELFPATTIKSTLQKAALGQAIFGPVITCVFFAASLLSMQGLPGLRQLPAKIRQDLLPTQLAGAHVPPRRAARPTPLAPAPLAPPTRPPPLRSPCPGCGYWPFVDLISYSYVPVIWIPLFVNGCSFIWTIFLSLKAGAKLSIGR